MNLLFSICLAHAHAHLPIAMQVTCQNKTGRTHIFYKPDPTNMSCDMMESNASEEGRCVGRALTALVSNGHLHQRAPLKHISYAGLDELLWFMRQAHTHKHKHTHLPTINISLCFAVVCDMFTLLFSPLLLCCLSIRLFDCLTICHFCCQQFGVASKREFIHDITVTVPQSVDADISCLASE